MTRTRLKDSLQVFESLAQARSAVSQCRTSAGVLAIRVAFYDRVVAAKVPGFQSFLKAFDLAIPLRSGESLKSLDSLQALLADPRQAPRLLALPTRQTVFFAIGGGSVGDFVGFLASTFHRGVALIQVPTTWLAAVDSAHGGKTALNVGGFKNVLGTFHPPRETWLVHALLKGQPEARRQEAQGEIAKMALLDRRVWKSCTQPLAAATGAGVAPWPLLPELVQAKLRVVARDPREERGHRRILNLGHTLGHVLEASLELPHGNAVGIGLFFALWVSWCEGLLATRQFFELEQDLMDRFGLSPRIPGRLPKRPVLRRKFLGDKKSLGSGQVAFVGLRGIGKPVILPLSVDTLLTHLDHFNGDIPE